MTEVWFEVEYGDFVRMDTTTRFFDTHKEARNWIKNDLSEGVAYVITKHTHRVMKTGVR